MLYLNSTWYFERYGYKVMTLILHIFMETQLLIMLINCLSIYNLYAAAAAKSLQSCPTLCDPIDGSPPGSPVPGILQARTLEWVAICMKVKSESEVAQSCPTPSDRMDCSLQASPTMGFSRLILKWLKNITGFLSLIIHIHSNLCKNFYSSLIKLSINMVLLDIFEHLHLTSTYIFSCIILKKDFPPKVYFNHGNYFLIQWIHFLYLLSYIVVFIRMNS